MGRDRAGHSGRARDESLNEAERKEAKHARGAMDPGLKEQFERDRSVVRDHPSDRADADALQRPHYEPEPDGEPESERRRSAHGEQS